MRTNENQFREKVTKTMRGGMIDGASFTNLLTGSYLIAGSDPKEIL